MKGEPAADQGLRRLAVKAFCQLLGLEAAADGAGEEESMSARARRVGGSHGIEPRELVSELGVAVGERDHDGLQGLRAVAPAEVLDEPLCQVEVPFFRHSGEIRLAVERVGPVALAEQLDHRLLPEATGAQKRRIAPPGADRSFVLFVLICERLHDSDRSHPSGRQEQDLAVHLGKRRSKAFLRLLREFKRALRRAGQPEEVRNFFAGAFVFARHRESVLTRVS